MLNQHVFRSDFHWSWVIKYGLVQVFYQKHLKKKDYYSPGDRNLGDYIQTLAAKQYLPHVDELIDRDGFADYDNDPVKVIMNGWYHIFSGNDSLPDKMNPLFISFNISNTQNPLPNSAREYLKKYEPIGCRDIGTAEYLEKHGIRTYFSSCLTTTLDKKYSAKPEERTDEIIFTDYKFKFRPFNKTQPALKKILKKYDSKNIEYLTHKLPFSYSGEEAMRIAESVLYRYARAKLVVTTRIHAALPCLAIKTPVIFISKRYDKTRYKGIDNFFNFIGQDEDGNFISDVQFDENGLVKNPENHLQYVEKLKKDCAKFIESANFVTV